MTPSAYLIPSTDVPVTIGRLVCSIAPERALVEAWRVDEPPDVRDNDIVNVRRIASNFRCGSLMVLRISPSCFLVLSTPFKKKKDFIIVSLS